MIACPTCRSCSGQAVTRDSAGNETHVCYSCGGTGVEEPTTGHGRGAVYDDGSDLAAWRAEMVRARDRAGVRAEDVRDILVLKDRPLAWRLHDGRVVESTPEAQ